MRRNAEVLVNKVKLIRRSSRQVYQLKLVIFVDLVGVSCAAIFFHFIHHARKLYDSPLILPQKNQRARYHEQSPDEQGYQTEVAMKLPKIAPNAYF